MSWKCEKCLHYVADKVKHDCINDEHDKLQSENARLKEKLEVAMEFISTMSTINEHLGYKFTQPIIKVREKLKQIRDDKEMG